MAVSPKDLIPCQSNQLEIGKTYSRLTIKAIGRTASRSYYAVCDCECGTKDIAVRIDGIRKGSTKSCGCFTKDRLKTHGLSGNPVFRRWIAMMARCYNPNHPSYPNYGGRGIKVCQRWHDPKNFVSDMNDGFNPSLQLDRIDSNGNYSKSNCRWISQRKNLDNKRKTHRVSYNGHSLTVNEWSKKTGISAKLIRKRIFERQWEVERALTTTPLSKHECAKIASAHSHKTSLNR